MTGGGSHEMGERNEGFRTVTERDGMSWAHWQRVEGRKAGSRSYPSLRGRLASLVVDPPVHNNEVVGSNPDDAAGTAVWREREAGACTPC